MLHQLAIREATVADLSAIRDIYNEGIEDRVATLDTDPRSPEEIAQWWSAHDTPYAVLLATGGEAAYGWAALNRFSHRCAHDEIADLSIYVSRSQRGKGVGSQLLRELIVRARAGGFHKIVLHALDANEAGKRLYRARGFSDVGVFREHGRVDGSYVDVIAMELLL